VEIAFEEFLGALEVTRGTVIPVPTHSFYLGGTIQQAMDVYRKTITDGTLELYASETITRKWSEWQVAGAIDTYNAPFWFNMLVKPVTTGVAPPGGTTSRLWTFTPIVTSDVQKSATLFFGDPNVQIWQAAYSMADAFTITSDATGTDPVMIEINGMGQPMTKVSDPVVPTRAVGDALLPTYMQCWIDTGAGVIGTTEVVSRLVSATLSADLTRTRKFLPGGPTSGLSFNRTGVGKRAATSTLRFEVPDTAEWDLMDAGTPCKVRVRISGAPIAADPGQYHYIQWDIFGILAEPAWGEFETTNRTLDVTITSTKDATVGYSWALYVQSNRTTL